jgi:Na+:H+ antiporter, NhaA family
VDPVKISGNRQLDKVLRPLQDFLRLESSGGLALMGTAVLALIIANSPLSPYYAKLLDLPLEIRIGTFGIAKPLLLWINDGLMAVFFFLVGMELKREVLEGHLSSLRQASLPAFAAMGGMLAPAAFYAVLNWDDSAAMRGWAIPTATDIAFALGVLTLLGKRVPAALKAFLLSVAIFDDLGAVVVIALFYTAELSLLSLVVAACLILGLACLNRWNVTRPAAYFLLGIPLWVAVLKSGVHATLAGVALAMFIPLRVPEKSLVSQTPEPLLRHLEHTLHPWVAFGVLPVFAFANAGVSIVEPSCSPWHRDRVVSRQADRGPCALLACGAVANRVASGRSRLVAPLRHVVIVRHRFHHEPVHRVACLRAGRHGLSGAGAARYPDRHAGFRGIRLRRASLDPGIRVVIGVKVTISYLDELCNCGGVIYES